VSNVSAATREIVYGRAGLACELCHRPAYQGSVHHRRPRGMGGSKAKWLNMPANLLLVCGSGTSGCHGKIESYREMAYNAGWLLRWGEEPEHRPFVDSFGRWWKLDNEGAKTEVVRDDVRVL
jgi:5-methylcytosine-specific restriction protein A